MKCTCGQTVQYSYTFCPKCGTKIVNPFSNPVGTWHVTTEGDCEGRTIKDLGVHTGHVVDIARALGGNSYYALQFEPVVMSTADPVEPPECKSVSVCLSIDSGTWDLTPDQRVQWMKDFLGKSAAKNFAHVHPGQYFSSVVLKF